MLSAALFAGCAESGERGEPGTEAKTPNFTIAMDGFGTATRSAVNYSLEDYFTGQTGGLENIEVTFNGVTKNHTYSGGVLVPPTPADAFIFPAGGNPVDMKVSWPAAANRKLVTAPERKDQSTKAAFLAEDHLTADMPGVMPTYSVSVFMKHERAKIAFVPSASLAGAATITEFTFGDFKAFLNTEKGVAEIMIDPTTDAPLFTAGASGTIKTSAGDFNYTLDAAVTGIEAGSYHEITLNL